VEKVYAFIDSQNLNLGIKDLGWNLDFARFRVYLKDKYKVSNLLRKFREYFIYVADLREKLERKKRGSDLRTKP
jgi:hypothetical protein